MADEIGVMGILALATLIAITFISGLIGKIIPVNLPEIYFRIWIASIYVSLIAITIGIFLKLVGWMMPTELGINKSKIKDLAETPRPDKLATGKIPASIPSVTESTTKLLEDRTAKNEPRN